MPPVEAIYQACLLRFRPIMMTTMAALFGGLPLAIGMGVGSELRRPLGIAIVGGLIVCQMLTLFTTPVVYLFFDRLQWQVMKLRRIGAELEEARETRAAANLSQGTFSRTGRYTFSSLITARRSAMEKLDLKKQWKHLYQRKAGTIVAVDVPPLTYLMVDGEGDPNTSQAFQEAIEALYSLSYTLKFTLKKSPRAIDYGVMPLEGLWWADDPRVFHQADKSTWKWTAMILQPEFIAQAEVDAALTKCARRRTPPRSTGCASRRLTEGPSAQVLYMGPFSDEGPTIQRMHDFIHAAGKATARQASRDLPERPAAHRAGKAEDDHPPADG